MERLQIGTRVRPLGINRINVAAGTKCRCVLVDPNPQFKYIAYDEELRRKVEVNQDLLIKYSLRASPTFYYLVAKLNTDMKGNVVDDDFVIEYLQLSENLNNEFADAVSENPDFNSLVLAKVEKKGDGGKDFSYVKTTPSNFKVSQYILDKIEKLRNEPGAIDAMWALIDRTTSISPTEYIALKEEQTNKTAEVAAPALAPRFSAPALAPKAEAPIEVPSASDSFAKDNDFTTDDDFNF